MKPLCPPGWPRPKGYANAMAARGRTIFTAGIVGWDESGTFVSDTLPGQFAQTLKNILAILRCDGAGPENIARLLRDLNRRLSDEPQRNWRGLESDHRTALSGDGAGRGQRLG